MKNNKLIEMNSILLQAEAVKIYVKSMEIENELRLGMGQSIAYTENVFIEYAKAMNDLSKKLLGLLDAPKRCKKDNFTIMPDNTLRKALKPVKL